MFSFHTLSVCPRVCDCVCDMHLTQELDKAIAQTTAPLTKTYLRPSIRHSIRFSGKFVVFAPDCQIKYLENTARKSIQQLNEYLAKKES